MKQVWFREFDLNYPLDKLLVFARKIMLSGPSSPVGPRVSRTQVWWPSTAPLDFWQRCEKIAPLRSYFGDFGPRFASIWEYPEYDVLSPHIDDPGKGATSLIIPLIGRFRTDRYKSIHDLTVNVSAESLNRREATEEQFNQVSKEIDTEPYESHEYGPGKIFLLNNSVYFHGGEPLDDYRLCMQVYVSPDYDLDKLFTDDKKY